MTTQVVIHPGFVKTATSSLQKQVFSLHDEVSFIGASSSREDGRAICRYICQTDSTLYDASYVSESIRRLREAQDDSKTLVVSYENFALYESKDKGVVATRLHDAFPEAKVFFSLRKQEDILASWYLQKLPKYIKGNNFISFEKWLKIKLKKPHRSILDDLRFGPVINRYKSLFGRENIAIFLFEQLAENPRAFSQSLASFIGIDDRLFLNLLTERRENLTISQRYLNIWRQAGSWLPDWAVRKLSTRLDQTGGPPARVDIGGLGRDLIHNLCAEDNRVLEQDYAVPLSSYSYAMPDPGDESNYPHT